MNEEYNLTQEDKDKIEFNSIKKEMDYHLDLAVLEIQALRHKVEELEERLQEYQLKEEYRYDDYDDDEDNFGHDPFCESCPDYGNCLEMPPECQEASREYYENRRNQR